jgi:transcriptional regulator with XRE-family HTH domain
MARKSTNCHSGAAETENCNENCIVGLRIAEGRIRIGLTQAGLADLLFVTAQCVGKWERGESVPDVFMLGKIGNIIGRTDLNYFLGKNPCDCGCPQCCGKQ